MPPLDRHCLSCGKSVLSIATRCPGCGVDLPPPPAPPPSPRRNVHPIFVVAAAAILLALGLSALALARKAFEDNEVAAAPTRAEAADPLDTGSAAATATVPDSAPTPTAVIRVAQTWTKVRNRRSVHADVVAILLPGDTVLADSLKGGWWRVSLEGRVLGYSWDRTLIGN